MSPWKGWSVNGRSGQVDGVVSPQRERSGGVAGSQDLGLIQPPVCGSPVAGQGWSALRQGPVAVAPTSWTGWNNGREGSVTPVQTTPVDKNPDNRPSPVSLAGVEVPRASEFAVAVSLFETVVLSGQGCDLGKWAETGDIVPPPQRASQTLEEVVARSRAGRKFLCGGYKSVLKLAKVKVESVVEDKILAEELSEAVDKYSLSLTNKDFQTTLVMSIETFHITSAERLFKAMYIKTTSESLNKEDVDRMR